MKVLIANRGEIAVRILRTCRDMNIPSVAVFTDVDEMALHVRYADEAVAIGEERSYLDGRAILEAARKTGATAIHPGYGFLSENAEFAGAVEQNGLTFIGPRPETIAQMGDKLKARQVARQAGLPVLTGIDKSLSAVPSAQELESLRFPVMVKAIAGGGGRGIRLAHSPEELLDAVNAARQEALATFQDGAVYIESLVENARHIEVQILGDGLGNVVCLGDRECSIQRRRQKLIEESPASGLREEIRQQISAAALRLGQMLRYRSLGTVEFLLDTQDQFYFIEVNPRIQVEHPVTEMVTGLDLVRDQLCLAAGEPLGYRERQVIPDGVAIEARILAEDVQSGFLPATGEITYLKEPGGPGIRVDSALFKGMSVGAQYDSLLAKVIAWGRNRHEATQRLQRALDETQIGGVTNDLDFLKQIIQSPEFIAGKVTTTFLDQFHPSQEPNTGDFDEEIALAAVFHIHQQVNPIQQLQPAGSQWLLTGWREQMC